MKRVSILGSTGSIGVQALDVISRADSGAFEVIGLAAGSDHITLIEQAIKFKPKYVALHDETKLDLLRNALFGFGIEVMGGANGVANIAALEHDQIVAAISGSAGLRSTYMALRNGHDVLLANKETMVCAGVFMMDTARKYNAQIIPVDSEHNAIFQCLESNNRSSVEKITLTASGGPFRGYSVEQLQSVDVVMALRHPNWSMGRKVTIDSATLFNKGLEVIEASVLFKLPSEQIDVVVHPESIIHSMVHYEDGSILAQMGPPDMRVPLCHSLYWPKRYDDSRFVSAIDFAKVSSLNFYELDSGSFPSVSMCREALRLGKSYPMALNAMNEIAVSMFLDGKIKFLDIFALVQEFMNHHNGIECASIDQILDMDQSLKLDAKFLAEKYLSQYC